MIRAEDIAIDEEFATMIPPLSDEEFTLLEESILRDGCRDALVVWAEPCILLDGHNRKRICEAHGIPYATTTIELPNREAAEDWIDTNQLGRRNLTPDQASLLRGRRYNRTKTVGHGAKTGYQNDTQNIQTAERLATQHGVSAPTIKRDGQFARAVEELKAHVPDIERRVMTGDIPSRQDVIEAAKEPEKAPERLAVHFSSETPEWYTPADLLDLVVQAFGVIDLDPCSNSGEPNVPATMHYTVADNGLAQAWHGRVFMNPPYGREIVEWIEKLVEEYRAGRVTQGIALVPARTDTAWFRMLRDFPRCFISGRLRFNGSDTGAPFPSMVVYLGHDITGFAGAFSRIGDIFTRLA